MLAAYRTPSTAEELSVEVGVALPYIEEELNALTENTLMKKNGKKYETNFFIISADAQRKAELCIRDSLENYAAVHEDYSCGNVARECHLVSYDYHCKSRLRERLHYLKHLSYHFGVKSGCRLVEQYYVCLLYTSRCV